MKKYMRHESIEDYASVKKYFDAICESLQEGKFSFMDDGDECILNVEGKLKFEVKAKKKDQVVKLALRIEWEEKPTSRFDSSSLIIETEDNR